MRRTARIAGICVFLAGAAALLAAAPRAEAAQEPTVVMVVEGREAGTSRGVLLLLGKKLTSIKSCELLAPDLTPVAALTAATRTSTMMGLSLPDPLAPGSYVLRITFGRDVQRTIPVELALGTPPAGSVDATQLAAELRGDLDDAATLGGESLAAMHDAGKLDAGTLDVARFSAFDDLASEARIGAAAGQVAAGDHGHDDRYFTETELSSAGAVNTAGNPLEWSKLKNVPADFADGVDDNGGYAAGDGLSLAAGALSVSFAGTGAAVTASRSDHEHDARYFTETDLSSMGTINMVTNPVDWTRLKGVPAGFADGVDGGSEWTLSGADIHRTSGKVGIGTSSPAAALHVESNAGILATGTYSSSLLPPVSGAGTRLMWVPSRGAFRAGTVSGVQWDSASLGSYSFATGLDTTASGFSTAMGYGSSAGGSTSTALGYFTTASGDYSTAMGYGSSASGDHSKAMGYYTTASGSYSTAMGYYATASGNSSTAMGDGSTATGTASTASGRNALASGAESTATGYNTAASGLISTAMGFDTTASGSYSTAIGCSTTAQPFASLVLGRYNVIAGSTTSWVSTDPVLVVGSGSGSTSRANALTLLKNGSLTILGTLTQISDARLKQDVEPLRDVLPRLRGIHGVSYRFRDVETHPGGRQIGLVAQEVEAAFPELVSTTPEGNLAVAYGNFSAVLLAAIQEQDAVIEVEKEKSLRQQAEIDGLRADLAAMEERLRRLEDAR